MKVIDKSPAQKNTLEVLSDIAGCKWSLAVLKAIDSGYRRPGRLKKAIDGISTKVLNQRLIKLTRYRLIQRKAFPVIPPKVEYSLTSSGRSFIGLLKKIEKVRLT